MIEESSKEISNLYFLKVRFLSDEKGTYGILYILFDPKRNHYEKMNLIATHYRTFIEEIVPETGWDSCSWSYLEDVINQALYKGDFADNITKELKLTIEKVLKSAEIEMIVPMVEKKEVELLKQKFLEIFSKATGESKWFFDFAFEFTTSQEIEKKEIAKKETYVEEQKKIDTKIDQFQKSKLQTPTSGVTLDVSFVLSPVKGIPIAELKKGDIIIIRIDINNPKGMSFANLLEVIRDGEGIPFPAQIEKIEKSPIGEYFVITKIQDGIFGKISETEQVKIRRFDPEKDQPLKEKKPSHLDKQELSQEKNLYESINKNNKTFILILGGAFFFLIIFIIVYFFY